MERAEAELANVPADKPLLCASLLWIQYAVKRSTVQRRPSSGGLASSCGGTNPASLIQPGKRRRTAVDYRVSGCSRRLARVLCVSAFLPAKGQAQTAEAQPQAPVAIAGVHAASKPDAKHQYPKHWMT